MGYIITFIAGIVIGGFVSLIMVGGHRYDADND